MTPQQAIEVLNDDTESFPLEEVFAADKVIGQLKLTNAQARQVLSLRLYGECANSPKLGTILDQLKDLELIGEDKLTSAGIAWADANHKNYHVKSPYSC